MGPLSQKPAELAVLHYHYGSRAFSPPLSKNQLLVAGPCLLLCLPVWDGGICLVPHVCLGAVALFTTVRELNLAEAAVLLLVGGWTRANSNRGKPARPPPHVYTKLPLFKLRFLQVR